MPKELRIHETRKKRNELRGPYQSALEIHRTKAERYKKALEYRQLKQFQESFLKTVSETSDDILSRKALFSEDVQKDFSEWDIRSERPQEQKYFTSEIELAKIINAFLTTASKGEGYFCSQGGEYSVRMLDGEIMETHVQDNYNDDYLDNKPLFKNYMQYGCAEVIETIDVYAKLKLLELSVKRAGILLGRSLGSMAGINENEITPEENKQYFYSRIARYSDHVEMIKSQGNRLFTLSSNDIIAYIHLGMKSPENYEDADIENLVKVDMAQMQRNIGAGYIDIDDKRLKTLQKTVIGALRAYSKAFPSSSSLPRFAKVLTPRDEGNYKKYERSISPAIAVSIEKASVKEISRERLPMGNDTWEELENSLALKRTKEASVKTEIIDDDEWDSILN